MNNHLAERYSFEDKNFSLIGYWWTDQNGAHWFVCEGRMTFGVSLAGSEISISDGVRFSEKIALKEGVKAIFCEAESKVRMSIEAQRKTQEALMVDFMADRL